MEITKKLLVFFIFTFSMSLAKEPSIQEFTKGNNLFTISVYKELAKKENDNFMISPFSIETALALTQLGGKGETAQEIKTALHLPNDDEIIKSNVKDLQKKLKRKEGYALQTADKIYIKENFKINDDFKNVATDVFGADLENINFEQRDVAAKTINGWVQQKTNNKIHNLIDPDSLNDRTRAIIIDALYFKGKWTSRFDTYLTMKKNFYRTSSDVSQVATMRDLEFYKYYESSELGARFLELPLQGEGASVTIILPNEKEGLTALENQIERVFETPKYDGFEYVNVSLPKFKFETKMDFKEILQKLGVNKAFRDDEADLSGIAGNKGDLIIDKILQKTFVGLNEDGVEAAAASAVQVGVPLSGIFATNPPKEFIADHPFLFYIKVDDLILFAGRVVSPTY